MIVGIDHFQFNPNSLDKTQDFLEQNGYTESFKETPLIYLKPNDNSYAVELIEEEGHLKSFNNQHYFPEWGKEQKPFFNSLQLCVRDLEKSSHLWIDGLGFKLDKKTDTTQNIQWPEAMLNPLLKIQLTSNDKNIKIHEQWASCKNALLGLISTNLNQDTNRLCQNYFCESIDQKELIINNRPLIAQFLKGPSDELFELIEFTK